MQTLTLSSKGQLTLPAGLLRELGLKKGSQLLLLQRDDEIRLIPAERVAQLLEDDLADWHALSAPAFAEVWDNEADEVWNDV